MAALDTWPVSAPADTSVILEYKQGQTIYRPDQAGTDIYLVLTGKVMLRRKTPGANTVIVDLIASGGVFGESALLAASHRAGEAVAIEDTALMVWSAAALLDTLGQSGLTLLRGLADRTTECAYRIESLSMDAVDRRLAWSLLRFAERLGTREPDGAIRVMPLTHQFLAQYIGTSRENVTRTMIRFRRQGYLRYSRQGIRICPTALRGWLEQFAPRARMAAMVH